MGHRIQKLEPVELGLVGAGVGSVGLAEVGLAEVGLAEVDADLQRDIDRRINEDEGACA
jgi:hypothetical protein